MAAVSALGTLGMAVGLFSNLGFTSGIFGLVFIVCGFLFAWSTYRSGKAIAAREDAHFSFFIAGINVVAAFPFGLLYSMYAWRVLSRPSVRDLYGDPHKMPSLPPGAKTVREAKSIVKLVQAVKGQEQAESGELDDSEEAIWREMEREHKKKTSKEAVSKIKIVSADDNTQ